MRSESFMVEGEVQLFDRPGGWHYVAVPPSFSEELAELGDRGLIPIRATVGEATWNTSLLPMGDGTHFIALNARVRATEDLGPGDPVTLTLVPREP